MTDAKICPMQNTTCIREKCGWWCGAVKRCAVLDIAVSLDLLVLKET